jgi:hypothetical protein
VALDSFEREAHLHIVLDVDIVKPEANTIQQRAFPPLVTGNDPIVDLLNLFRGEPGTDTFNNVLVISLAVKTAVDRVFVDTRL